MIIRFIIREELDIPQDAFLLVSVGELNKNKNHSVVIKALGRLKSLGKLENHQNIHYLIAGQGSMMDALRNLASDCVVADQVHLLGYRKDIPALYMSADACVFPSIREGLGLAAIEGMASGLPLIVADNRGTRDYVVDGENGIVCRYDDVDGFAEAIEKLRNNEEIKEKMKMINLTKSANFDLLVIKEVMTNVYNTHNTMLSA